MKKGISPLIATILAIAMLTVMVVIASTWIKDFTKNRIEEAEKSRLKLYCSNEIQIELTNLNNNQLTIENRGRGLQGFSFLIDGEFSYDDSTPLGKAGVKIYELEKKPGQNVKVTPLLGYKNGFIKCGSQSLVWRVTANTG